MIQIAKERIGKFTTLAEGRTYQRAMSIKDAALSAAREIKRLDETADDINSSSPGYVLVDRANIGSNQHVSGFCKFDPNDGELVKLDYKKQSVYDSILKEDVVRMEQRTDGSTRYQSDQGVLVVDAQGNLVFDPSQALPNWT